MHTKELLEILKITENDSFEKAQEACNQLIAEQERLAKLRKIGAASLFGSTQPSKITVKEIQDAWQGVNSENKYMYYWKTGTIQAEVITPIIEKTATAEQSISLKHLTKDRPQGPAHRKRPTKKKFDASQETVNDKVIQTSPRAVVIDESHIRKEAPLLPSEPLKKSDTLQYRATFSSPITSNDLTLEEIQQAVLTAYTNYTNYHTKNENKQDPLYNRGQGAGFFSFLRHGAKGLATAKALYESVNSDNHKTRDETVKELKKFLGDSSRAYHHHSFTSYLADALADKKMITPNKLKHYNQKEVVENLEKWLENNPPLLLAMSKK